MIRIGDILQERYRVVEALGSGGFGAVYKAEDRRLGNRPVAIKAYYTDHLSEEEAEERARLFTTEAHTLARLSHPNLAQVLDYFIEGRSWLLIMEFVPGQTLADVLRDHSKLPEQQVIEWAIELCRVLEYLHRQRPPLIFRDLKPSNCMLTPEGRVILIDFGIARSFKEGQQQDTQQLATPGYAPPEQYGRQTEPRSDLYSLGATMYVLLTGTNPASFSFHIPHLSERAPRVSPALADLVRRATAFEVEDRPPSAAAMRQELEGLRPQRYVAPVPQPPAAQPPVSAYPALPEMGQPQFRSRTPTHPPPVAAPPRRPPAGDPPGSRMGLVLVTLLLLALLGAGAWLFMQNLPVEQTGGPVAVDQPTPTSAPTAEPSITLAPSGRDDQAVVIAVGDQADRNIALLPLDGGKIRLLVEDSVYDSLPNRNKDGDIVFTRSFAAGEEHIFVAQHDGGHVRQLTSGQKVNRAGAWSPDGKLIAFESNRDGASNTERDLYVMDPDGNNVRALTTLAKWQGGPAWSPDGLQLAFHSNTTGHFQIFILNIQTGATRLLTGIPGEEAYWPSWSPDGATIAFMTQKGDDREAKIYLVPASGGQPRQLDLGPGLNRWPRWSPDGSLLAFESSRDGRWQVYLYTVATGDIRRISDGQTDDRWPSW